MERTRRSRMVLSAIVAGLLFSGSFATSPAQATREASPVSADTLRVMTYNTHHSAGIEVVPNPDVPVSDTQGADATLDLPRIADVINAEIPAIVALQEVDRFWARSAHADQPKELARLLHMDVCYGANVVHGVDEHADNPHEYGVATLSRYPIINRTHLLFPTTPGWEQRGMLDTRIDVPVLGEMAVINTHLQVSNRGQVEEGRRQRIEQSQRLADYISSLDVPVIVLGDFNAGPNSGDLMPLVGPDSSLTDVWETAGTGTGETIFNGAHGEATARIDYILVSHHFKAISAEVIDNDRSRVASDHFPLVAELGFMGIPGAPYATPSMDK